MPASGPYILQVTQQTVQQYDTSMQPNKTFRMVQSSDGTNASVVSGIPGGVALAFGSNVSATARYLKMYDLARLPNVGTDVPYVTKYLAGQSDFETNGSGSPLVFSNGIAIAFTALPDDNDATPIVAGDIMGLNIAYY